MQAINAPCMQEAGYGACAPLQQDPPETGPGERTENVTRRNRPVFRPVQNDLLDIGRKPRAPPRPTHDEPAHTIIAQDTGGKRQAAVRIDHHPRRAAPVNAPYGKLRIIGENRPDPHHHRIHMGADRMQMVKRVITVDIEGMPRHCRDAPVEGLSELGHDEGRLRAARAEIIERRSAGKG